MNILKAISTITNPAIIAIPLFLIINIVLGSEDFIQREVISVVFTSIIPMLIIVIGAKLTNSTDNDISRRQDRFGPLIVGVVSYFIGFLVLYFLNMNEFLTYLMLCYSINTFIVMLITLKWKISIHTTGISGPISALFILNPYFSLLGLIYPVLIYSRVKLKKHTYAQAVCGGVFGFFATVLEMSLFVPVDLIWCLWIVLAIIIVPVMLGADLSKLLMVVLVVFLVFAPLNVFVLMVLVLIECVLINNYDGSFEWFKAG